MKVTTTSATLTKAQIAALLIMLFGWGWLAGNFAQPQEPLFADALTDFLHAVPAILLFIFGWRYFSALSDTSSRREGWAYIGVNVIAILAVLLLGLGGIVLSLLGISTSNPNSVGIHNLDDAIPAVLVLGGSLLWLVAAFLARRQRGQASGGSAH